MIQVGITEAKPHFSKLIDRVARGEAIVICKRGKPVARLVPYRRPGSMKGKIWISPDFDGADKEIETMFYGE